MGSWHLIAYCALKKGLRDFALSRIRSMEILRQTIKLPKGMPSIKEFIRMNFGLMAGKKSVEVCLKFAPAVSSWISEQIWFSGQKVVANKDGSIGMRLPVADFGEIRKEILKYGASVEVLAPRELRDQVREEIQRMAGVYKVK
jgi:predicted DNA-binding transcriptional regulator YafY